MDSMEAKLADLRRRMPSKRALTSQLGQFVQQKSVAVLYTQSEQDRIKSVTELISKATCEFEKEEHWDRIMKVVDVLSNTSNKHVLKEAIRFLRLRLGDPSPRVVLLALTLTETLVKNCNAYIHKEIASETFMGEMEALYKVHSCKRGRDSMEIEGRVLELIQAWGEAFMDQKFEYPYFIYTYEKLRKKGVRFPKFNKNTAPIFTPPASKSSSSSSSSRSMQGRITSLSSTNSSLEKLSPKEVYHVATNVAEMFEDMIHEAEQDSSTIADRGVIVELAVQAQELVHRLQTVIQTVADSESEDLGKYLAVNDQLHTAIMRYEELKAGNKDNNNARRRSTLKAADTFGFDSAPTNNQQHDNDDDEFGDFVRARVNGDAATPVATSNNQTPADEDDPFASFVQQRATKVLSAAPEKKTPEPAKDLIDLWDDAPLQPAPVSNQSVDDLWGSNDILLETKAPTPTPAPLEVPTPSKPALDDIWGDLVAAPVPAAAPMSNNTPAPMMAPPSNNANPFDFFDEFTTKAAISTPAPTSAPKSNPFDFSISEMSAPSQQPVRPAAPSTPLNPFDF